MSGRTDTRAEPSLAQESELCLRRGAARPFVAFCAGPPQGVPMPNPIADPLVEMPDTSPTSDLVRIEATHEGAATVVLNRPARKNAFDADLISAMSEAFETLRGAEGVRVVFLQGAGGTFSAGAALDWMRQAADRTESENRDDAHDMAVMMKRLHDLPQLTVAL